MQYRLIAHLTKAVAARTLVYDIMFRQSSSFIAIKNACQKLKMQHYFWQEKVDAYICRNVEFR